MARNFNSAVVLFAALILAPSVMAQQAPEGLAPSGATCPADADLSGLLEAVAVTRDNLTGLDREAVTDLMAVVATYQQERVGLCEALRQSGIKDEMAQIARMSAETMAALWKADSAKCHAALKELPARRAAPLGWSAGVGGLVDADGELFVGGAIIWGFRW